MAKSYTTHDEMMRHLRQLAAERSQKVLAGELGISRAMLNDVLRGRRDITERIALGLGFQREIIFRKTAA